MYAEKGEMEAALNVFREMKLHEAGRRWAQLFSEKGEKGSDATAMNGAVKVGVILHETIDRDGCPGADS